MKRFYFLIFFFFFTLASCTFRRSASRCYPSHSGSHQQRHVSARKQTSYIRTSNICTPPTRVNMKTNTANNNYRSNLKPIVSYYPPPIIHYPTYPIPTIPHQTPKHTPIKLEQQSPKLCSPPQQLDQDWKQKISKTILEIKQLDTPKGRQITQNLTNSLFAVLNILNKRDQLLKSNSSTCHVDTLLHQQVRQLLSIIQYTQNYLSSISPITKGTNNIISGIDNTIIGQQNRVQGTNNTAIGSENLIHGNENVMKGDKNLVIGNQSFVIGGNVTVKGNNTIVFGWNKLVDGNNTLIVGNHTVDLKRYK